MPIEDNTVRVFPAELFAGTGSVQFKQGDWANQTAFRAELQQSWLEQYSEYLGTEAASSLLHGLIEGGSLFDHDERTTLQAWMGDEIVGVASVRQLDGLSLLTLMEVKMSHRRQGIGSALLKALDAVCSLLVVHVSIHRPHLKLFYARSGFRELQPAIVDHSGHLLTFDVMVSSCLLYTSDAADE